MSKEQTHVVTGAFGFSGKYIARRLLDRGYRVRTLTNSPHRPNPFGKAVEVHPLDFDQPDTLTASLEGASVLYNTYWVRFNHKRFTHARAVEDSLTLFHSAKTAGVERIVHVSITNPSLDSPLEYFRGKAQLEKVLTESGVSHAILRPAVLFGSEDILVKILGDVVLTREEIQGLMDDLLYVHSPPAGTTRLTDWAAQHAHTLGACYASELDRRRR